MKWVLLCSDCEGFIVLKAAEKFPKSCPHCEKIFESNSEIKSEDNEHTFLPPIEKYLNKIKDKL